MRTTSIAAASATVVTMAIAGGILLGCFATSAPAQDPPLLAAHANVTVENSSPVPQLVAGTNVTPFELAPHQHAQLKMSVTPPPPPPGDRTIPVRFFYSVGVAPGPQCRGAIDMTVKLQHNGTGANEATHCQARSLGLGGASCNIAVSARSTTCEGGLAFVAP